MSEPIKYPRIEDEEYPYSVIMGLLVMQNIVGHDDIHHILDECIHEAADKTGIPEIQFIGYLMFTSAYIDKLVETLKKKIHDNQNL